MDHLRQRVLEALLEALALTQERSGRKAQSIDEDTIPLVELESFDSHNGVEVEVLVSERLGVEIDAIPFHKRRSGIKELSVREIVDAVLEKYGPVIPSVPPAQAQAVTQ